MGKTERQKCRKTGRRKERPRRRKKKERQKGAGTARQGEVGDHELLIYWTR